jgi:CDGSH-type Zn-finger protein
MCSDSEKRIRIEKNGPYVLSGAIPLTRETIVTDEAGESVAWEENGRFPERESCSMCRCGFSDAKPFCDGSHELMNFDGTETASRVPYEQAATRFAGPRVTLVDEPDLCSEARFCAAKGAAWNRVERDDDESKEIVIDECCMCPSGRYTADDEGGAGVIEPVLEQVVAVTQDPHKNVSGPLWVKGGIPVESSDGTTYEVRNRVTLCRCGKSRNKPFCDGTHIRVGFTDAD